MGIITTVRVKKSEDFKVSDLVIPINAVVAPGESALDEIGLVVGVNPYDPWSLEVLINGKVAQVSSYTVKLLSPG